MTARAIVSSVLEASHRRTIMRLAGALLLILVGLVPATIAHAQVWQMWVHANGAIAKFNTADVDSVTFVFADTTQPGTPSIAATALTGRLVQVSWTAVGDDGGIGVVTSQELRMASVPGLAFADMTPVPGVPAPAPAGTLQSVDVDVAPLSTTWFRLQVADDFGNSALSNEVSATTPADTPNVVIAEIYTAGGQGGAPYTHDYVVLFNPTNTTQYLSGTMLQFATFGQSNWNAVPLGGVIAAHSYFLVQFASNGSNGAPLPTPDMFFGQNLTTASGKIAFTLGGGGPFSTICPLPNARIIDLLGYGSAECYEGSGSAPVLGAMLAAKRNGGGCVDTDDNAADFTTGSPTPKNSASPSNVCP
jgi:hypothetical protein